MHAKRCVEPSARQLPPDVAVRIPTFGFIEGDKLDVSYVAHEARFGLTDKPRDAGVGPVILKIAYYREEFANK
jgi:hypothetical protein